MPPTAVHTPFREGEADKVGSKLYRKQILPLGKVEHANGTLDCTPELFADLAKSFTDGAFDQVPILLANEDNAHHSDPEKFRGELKALEVGDDGLYGVVELTDEGAKLIADNPKLGVSARIRQDLERGGKTFANAIEHVLGTLDPRTNGMGVKAWEAAELSEDSKAAEVTDLTDASYSEPVPPKLSDLSETDREALKALVAKAVKDKDVADLSDEDVERTLAKILAEAEADDDTDDDGPELSEEQRKSIELAESKAKDADERARRVEAELATERFERKRDELTRAGVPPAIIALAEPVLKGEAKVVELSNGTKIDAGDTVAKILDECKGVIDFSVIGTGEGEAGSQEAEAKAAAEAWAKQGAS